MAKGGSPPLIRLRAPGPAAAMPRQGRHPVPSQSRAGTKLRPNPPNEAATMTKYLLYMASTALVGLMATQTSAAPVAWGGSMARNIAAATADAKDAPLVLVQRGGGRGGGGGGGRGGGG